jgi:hypothetical protein
VRRGLEKSGRCLACTRVGSGETSAVHRPVLAREAQFSKDVLSLRTAGPWSGRRTASLTSSNNRLNQVNYRLYLTVVDCNVKLNRLTALAMGGRYGPGSTSDERTPCDPLAENWGQLCGRSCSRRSIGHSNRAHRRGAGAGKILRGGPATQCTEPTCSGIK